MTFVFNFLLFADDMAIIGKCPQELQKHLNFLHKYCDKLGLTGNRTKTKITVSLKRGRPTEAEKWIYAGQNIEVVDNFNYLGVVLNYTRSFVSNQAHLTGKALKTKIFYDARI